MPSAKSYNREDLLDQAIELFRREGYSATSTSELVEELGVNRKSMYSEFGSKQELFEAALERYSAVHLSRVLAPIEDPEANVDTIRYAFSEWASAIDGRFAGLGCLMANTAVERAALDPGAARFVDAYLERMNAGFRRVLQNARASGEIEESLDIDDKAALLTMSVVGLSALIRAKAPAALVHAAGRAAVHQLSKNSA